MELTIVELLASIGGVGAVFGIIIFWVYRIDRRDSENRLTKLLEEDHETRKENTKALTELSTLLARINLNGRG